MESLAAHFADLFNPDLAVANFASLLSVILIDLALAGDNAVAVGLAAAALPAVQQRRAIFYGIVIALVLRIVFATVTQQLLEIDWLLFAGGLAYTVGTIFLVLDVHRFQFHAIWHLFVIAGSACHFVVVLQFVASRP